MAQNADAANAMEIDAQAAEQSQDNAKTLKYIQDGLVNFVRLRCKYEANHSK